MTAALVVLCFGLLAAFFAVWKAAEASKTPPAGSQVDLENALQAVALRVSELERLQTDRDIEHTERMQKLDQLFRRIAQRMKREDQAHLLPNEEPPHNPGRSESVLDVRQRIQRQRGY